MDPTIHTIIVGLVIGLAYHAGRYFGNKKVFEDAISTCLDKLERDGYLAVKKDKDGEKDMIPISEIVAEALRDARPTK
ncbi:uncharacterized protein METZ01_LOCUS115041 [marine metagenome]|uniref:Uncharacterized protein n=1 Tax=marine metagenome TaxID=408172 RepID=A0A381XDD6_9ZZZZ|tara:strand:+ start:252 stop:485 length:234 start_codon:yes stop_codon:yes gene_type:complete